MTRRCVPILWCQNNFLEHNEVFISFVCTLQNSLFSFCLLDLGFVFLTCVQYKTFLVFFIETALGDFYSLFYCSLTAAMNTHICRIDVKWYTAIYHSSCCGQITLSILGIDGIQIDDHCTKYIKLGLYLLTLVPCQSTLFSS